MTTVGFIGSGMIGSTVACPLLDQLASLPGYDPARCGELIATLPPPRPPLSPSLEPVP